MRWLRILLGVGIVLGGWSLTAGAETNPDQLAQATIDKALGYLKSQQKPDGGWQGPDDPPGITALVLRTFISDPQYNTNQPFLAKGFGKLLSYQVSNGGIYNQILACYNTAIAISALAESKDPAYRGAMLKAWISCERSSGRTRFPGCRRRCGSRASRT